MEQATNYSTRNKNITFSGTSIEENSKKCSVLDETDIIIRSKRTKNNIENDKKNARNVKTKKRKYVSFIESGYMKIKTVADNPTPEMVFIMVMNCVKHLKKRNGVSLEDICKYVGEKYQVDMDFYKSYVKTYLQLNVEGDKLQRIVGTDKKEIFKMKKTFNVQKVIENLVLSCENIEKEEKTENYSMLKSKSMKDKVSGNNFTPEMYFTVQIIKSISLNKIFRSTPKPTVNTVIFTVPSDRRLRSMKNTTENEKPKSSNLKERQAAEGKNRKKKAFHLSTSEMVMASIKSLRKRNGVTLEDIQKHIEENYQVNTNMLKSHVNKCLEKGVENGIFEKVGKNDANIKYKMKKSEKMKKESQISHRKKSNVKSATKKTALKKSVNK